MSLPNVDLARIRQTERSASANVGFRWRRTGAIHQIDAHSLLTG
jgi:hypothetical protein